MKVKEAAVMPLILEKLAGSLVVDTPQSSESNVLLYCNNPY